LNGTRFILLLPVSFADGCFVLDYDRRFVWLVEPGLIGRSIRSACSRSSVGHSFALFEDSANFEDDSAVGKDHHDGRKNQHHKQLKKTSLNMCFQKLH
jgi:hypothetical protein